MRDQGVECFYISLHPSLVDAEKGQKIFLNQMVERSFTRWHENCLKPAQKPADPIGHNALMEHSMQRFLSTTLVAGFALAFSTVASAGYATFSGEDLNDDSLVPLTTLTNSGGAESLFKSKLASGVATETFEAQSIGAIAPLALVFKDQVTSATKVTATLGGGSGSVQGVTPGQTDGAGRYSIPSASSSNYWLVNAADRSNSFTVTFDSAVAAFGFYGVDIGDFGGTVSVSLLNNLGDTVKTFAVPHTIGDGGDTDGSVIFFGLIADIGEDFYGVRFTSSITSAADYFAFDNFTVATRDQLPPDTPLPLPGTLALAGLGLLGLGLRRARR